MIQPRKRSLWVWKLGSVKATTKACKRASSDGMIDHTGGGSWLLEECQRHGGKSGLSSSFLPQKMN